MSTAELEKTLHQLRSSPPPPPAQISSLLTSAKRSLLHLNCLIPTSSSPPTHLTLARHVLESGACLSIRLQDPDAFTRYVQQLAPFYELPDSAFEPPGPGEKKKVTGLYLLLLLTKGDYAGFHCVLEGLEGEVGSGRGGRGVPLEEDKYIGYPIKLERWLMEGSYDRVWKVTSGGEEAVPSEEFGVFSGVSPSTHTPLPVALFSLPDPSYGSAKEKRRAKADFPSRLNVSHPITNSIFRYVRNCRSLHPQSEAKSPRAPKKPIPLYQLQTRKIFSSSTVKAASSNSPSSAAGPFATGVSISRPPRPADKASERMRKGRRKICSRRADRLSKIRLGTRGSWRRSCSCELSCAGDMLRKRGVKENVKEQEKAKAAEGYKSAGKEGHSMVSC